MKKFYILLFLLFSAFRLICMDLKPDQIAACNTIKKIGEGSFEEYLGVARGLKKSNVNTCTCIQHFMKEKEKKAHAVLEKEFELSPDIWQKHDVGAQESREEDTKNAEIFF